MADGSMVGYGDYVYEAVDISAYDGDSLRCTIRRTWDFGFHMHVTQEREIAVRLIGVDTPELRDKEPDWKAAGYLARDKARSWILKEPAGSVRFISMDKPDKYGRGLGDFENAAGNRLSAFLIEHGYGVPYAGQNKAAVEAAHAENIRILKQRGEI